MKLEVITISLQKFREIENIVNKISQNLKICCENFEFAKNIIGKILHDFYVKLKFHSPESLDHP